MTASELERVEAILENEGFDYAFRFYSEFKDVKDKKFHRLRLAYIKAADALNSYIDGHDHESE